MPMYRNGRWDDFDLPRSLLPDLAFYDGSLDIDREGGVVEFSAKALKQKCNLQADHFFIFRDASMTGKGIEIDVMMSCNEAEPVSQKLSLTFVEVPVEESDD